jgi:hypothetical protein
MQLRVGMLGMGRIEALSTRGLPRPLRVHEFFVERLALRHRRTGRSPLALLTPVEGNACLAEIASRSMMEWGAPPPRRPGRLKDWECPRSRAAT